MTTTVLLLGAGGSAAANVADSLRRADHDYRIVGADADPRNLHLSQADERVVVPRAADAAYRDALVATIEQYRCDIVHPQPDPDTLRIGALREVLPARTFLPDQAVLELAADKYAFARAMGAAGVAMPENVDYDDDLAHVVGATDGLLRHHERVWVRARRGAGARASLPVRTGAQAAAWISWWTDEKGMTPSDFMASEMLTGREFAYQSVWQDGELVAGQARERLVYLYGFLAPSGQSSTPQIARTVQEPAVDDVAQRAIRALDATPNGVYCVDIKESAGGVPMVTEINAGRFFTTSNFFAAAGLNMPDLAMRCALGERPGRHPSSPLPPDLYWIRMVDMGYVLVPGDEIDAWPRPGR
jgi:carbamoyl-phosphate synthase large subunit